AGSGTATTHRHRRRQKVATRPERPDIVVRPDLRSRHRVPAPSEHARGTECAGAQRRDARGAAGDQLAPGEVRHTWSLRSGSHELPPIVIEFLVRSALAALAD